MTNPYIKDWTKEEIEEFLLTEELSYQQIDLGHGLTTTGESRSETFNAIFGHDLRGASVLDVGSYLGKFCLEAKSRGAGRVVGWEVDSDRIRQARTIAEICKKDVSYEQRDIETVEIGDQQFDLVLCLNLLHHLADPIAALEKLMKITKKTLIIEVASLGRHDSRRLGLPAMLGKLLSKLPIVYVGNGSTSPPFDTDEKFYFSTGALRRILLRQRGYFARIDFKPSEQKDRFLALCHKRTIENLVIVAGPTAVGKSTFIRALKNDKYPDLNKMLDIASFQNFDHVGATSILDTRKAHFENLIFHYDFLRSLLRSSKTVERDEALHILSCAKSIKVVTLEISPSTLHQQLYDREYLEGRPKGKRRVLKYLIRKLLRVSGVRSCLAKVLPVSRIEDKVRLGSKRDDALLRYYANEKDVARFYDTWYDYLSHAIPESVQIVARRAEGHTFSFEKK